MASSSANLELLIKATDDASQTLRHISDNTDHLGTRAGFAAAAWSAAFDLMASAAGAVKDGIGFVISSAADFEQKMSAIKAVSGATAEDMTLLSERALQLGRDTSFSASEAAIGIEELVKGGVAVADIYGGAAQAALNLAAAGGVSLADAASIAANAMATFHLSGEETAHVADMIAGAANASTMSVIDFKFAMQSVGAVAALAGQSFDDTAVAISLMAQAGIQGSDAGTSLKTMLINLQNPSKDAKYAMEQLGIYTLDADAAMEAMRNRIEQHGEPALRMLDKAAKDNGVSGKELFKILSELRDPIVRGADDFEELAAKMGFTTNKFIDANGEFVSLREVAEALHEGMSGLDEATGLMALKMAFGTDAIRAAAILAEAGAEGFDNMAEAMSHVTAEAVAAERLDNFNGAMEELKGSLETAAIVIGVNFLPALRDLVDIGTDVLNTVVIPWAEQNGPAMAQAARDIATALGQMVSFIRDDVLPVLGSLGDSSEEAEGKVNDAMQAIETNLVQVVLPGVEDAVGQLAVLLHQWVADAIPQLTANFLTFTETVLKTISANAEPFAQAVIGEWAPAFTGWVLGTALPDLLSLLPQLVAQVIAWMITTGAPLLAEAAVSLGRAIANGTVTGAERIGQMVGDWIMMDLPPRIDAVATAMLTAAQSIGVAIIDGIKAGFLSKAGELNAAMQGLLSGPTGLLRAAQDAIGAHSPSEEFSEKVGKPIVEGIIVGIEDEAPDLFATVKGIVKDTILTASAEVEAQEPEIRRAWGNALTIIENALEPLGDVLTEAERDAGIFKGTLAEIPPVVDGLAESFNIFEASLDWLGPAVETFDDFAGAVNNAASSVGNFVNTITDPVQSTSPIPLPAPLPGGPGNNPGGSGPGGGGAGSTVNPILGGGPPPSGPNYSFGNGPYSGSGGISTFHFHGNQSHTHQGGESQHNHLQGSFAEGGIALGPTLAMIGDNPSGKEMIVPLERAGEMGFGGGGEIHIHLEGARIYGIPDLENELENAWKRSLRRGAFDKEIVRR